MNRPPHFAHDHGGAHNGPSFGNSTGITHTTLPIHRQLQAPVVVEWQTETYALDTIHLAQGDNEYHLAKASVVLQR
jgi:hypothetical protein